MVHFLASMPLVVDAVVLLHRPVGDYAPGSGRLLVPRPVLLLAGGCWCCSPWCMAAGTATTGAGPHAGGSQGQVGAKRIPVALRDMAELHSTLAILLVGVTLGLAVALHAIDVPERVRRAARILVVVLVAQAAVGYTQYFTHLPALLVELHVLGATVLVIGHHPVLPGPHLPRARTGPRLGRCAGGTADHGRRAPPDAGGPARGRRGPERPIAGRMPSGRRGPPPPSSSGPGRCPFKAVTRVRIPLGAQGDLDPVR